MPTFAEMLRRSLRTEPRPIPALRTLRTSLRTAHLLAGGALYGGHVYGAAPERLAPALVATLATGGILAALEVVRAPVWMVQLRGIATGIKLLLLLAVVWLSELRIAMLTLAIVIGGVVSHMPSRWRYYSPLHGRVVGPRDRG